MSTSGGGCGGSVVPARRPSRYESQKRRDWQTFVRYLAAHRPPLVLRRCSGAHVLEFLRYLDRFGKTRVHAPPCPAYGVRATSTATAPACQCPLRQAWGSLDALVGRLRAAFDERHGRGAAGGEGQQSSQQQQHDPNPFAARAVRLYLRDVRDAQSRARGVSYHKKKKKKKSKAGGSKAAAPAPSASSASLKNGSADADGERPRACGHNKMTTTANAAPASPPRPPLPPGLAGVPFDQCCDLGTIVGGGGSCYSAGGIFLPLLFNAFS